MIQALPLFPLGTVLFPGLLLPLHIFEGRYRQLVHDLLDGPEPREFGVLAIRKGRETGIDGVTALHEVGCTARVRRVARHEDGRFDLVTVGSQRFRLAALHESEPYLTGEVDLLAEEAGEPAAAAAAARAVQAAFRRYIDVLASRESVHISLPELPDEPIALSYLVASSMILDLPARQELLAEPDALRRLASERAMLSREVTMLRSLTVTPAPDLRNSPYSPN